MFSQRNPAAVGWHSNRPDLAEGLHQWLLTHPQLPEGPHRGGIVGWFGEGTTAEFVYPEIGGYFLSWLAFLDLTSHPDQRRDAAREALLGWLGRQLNRPGGPPTRTHLRISAATDWRNEARFSFDLGMVYRGVGATLAQSPSNAATAVWQVAAEQLEGLIDPVSGFRSHLLLRPGAALPTRWSTVQGPHLLKVAGGVLAPGGPPASDELTAAAWTTVTHHAPQVGQRFPSTTHPALYALEGLLQVEAAGCDSYRADLIDGYHRLTANLDGGLLPEDVEESDSPRRSDVLAQLLRLGCVLAGRGDLEAAHKQQLSEMANALARFADRSGGIWFQTETPPGSGNGHLNTWCAMMAHQALVFHRRVLEGGSIPGSWLRCLV